MSKTNIIDGFHGDVFTFARLKEEGIVGIIHKATQSTTIDPRYKARRKQRRDRVLWGAFDFATDSDWEEEVKRFLDVTEPGEDELSAWDYETPRAGQGNAMSLSR
jgi:lysozyme